MKQLGFIAVVIISGLYAGSAEAQNQLAGILRDEFALGLTPPLKSMGMGGAYVGVDSTQSMNPAALSGVDSYEAMLWYGFYDHDAGPDSHRGRMDGILPVPYLGGGARLMIDGMLSEDAEPTRLTGQAPIEYDSVTLGLQYGRNLTDWLAVGVGAYPYEKANVDMVTPLGTIEGEALSQIGSAQIGTLLRPHDKVRIGAQFIYIKDDLEASLPGGGQLGDYFDIHYYAIGASFTPLDGTLLAVDYWNGEIEGAVDPLTPFDQDVDRWNAGIQQRICEYFDLRLGYNNGGITTGFTVHVNQNLDLDYAYVNEALEDKEEILGNTEFHGVSMTYRF